MRSPRGAGACVGHFDVDGVGFVEKKHRNDTGTRVQGDGADLEFGTAVIGTGERSRRPWLEAALLAVRFQAFEQVVVVLREPPRGE